jgi:hypothetical protein
MDTSKALALSQDRDYGDFVNAAVIPSTKGVPVVLASLVVPLVLAVAAFVTGHVVVGIVFLVAIPVVYFVGLRIIGRFTGGHTALYCMERGVVYEAPDAEPVGYAWSDLKLTRRPASGSDTALDIDTLAGQRVITLDSSMHEIDRIQLTAQTATGNRG